MSKLSKKREVLLVEDVPAQLRRDFKASCAKKGVTMKKAIISILREFISARRL
jgi:hypothetical protein